MKKKGFVLGIVLFAILIGAILFFKMRQDTPFNLEDNYYDKSVFKEISYDDLNDLRDKKESFVVFVYQPMCATSADFEKVLSDFMKENSLFIYKIAFKDIKETELGEKIKYYPSFLVYKKGELIDFLEADSDEDVAAYTSLEGFTKWITDYVKLRESDESDTNLQDEEDDKNTQENADINLDYIVREDQKVNIYLFFGNGCPFCEKEKEFLESIKEEYGEYFNLYTFEIWYNDKNVKIANRFAEAMGEEFKSIPYTIIGDETFTGFNDSLEEKFIHAIEDQRKNGYDVYFDKIKK